MEAFDRKRIYKSLGDVFTHISKRLMDWWSFFHFFPSKLYDRYTPSTHGRKGRTWLQAAILRPEVCSTCVLSLSLSKREKQRERERERERERGHIYWSERKSSHSCHAYTVYMSRYFFIHACMHVCLYTIVHKLTKAFRLIYYDITFTFHACMHACMFTYHCA